MKDDLLRSVTDAAKRYTGVNQQQGKVQQDSDWNEQGATTPGGIADVPDQLERAGSTSGSNDSEWRYTPIRRLAVHLEQSLHEGAEWAVFEPNGEPARRAVEEVRRYLDEPEPEIEFENVGKLFPSSTPGETDIMALVSYVLRESYLDNQEDLKYFAEKLKATDDTPKHPAELSKEEPPESQGSPELKPAWKNHLKDFLDAIRVVRNREEP